MPGGVAEGLLWDELRRLPDDWFVYHQVRYVDDRAQEGEADFICLHRERGMLVVECKGKGVRLTGRGGWERTHHDGSTSPLERSPFDQAQDQMHDLVKELKPRVTKLFPDHRGFPFVFGYAAAFPRAQMKEQLLPLHIQSDLVYDASDLADIPARVLRTLEFWSQADERTVRPLDPIQFKNFRRKALHPKLDISPCLAADIAADQRKLVRLTEEQARAITGLLANRRFRVRGGAGTGKTMLALEAAGRLADEGARVLLICFNKALAQSLRETVQAETYTGGSVHATTFHKLCFHASFAHNNKPLDVPSDAEARANFWSEEAPFAVLQALEADKLDRYDAIVVDEGQDFHASWWEVLNELLRDAKEGKLLAFYDPYQNIFGDADYVPTDWPVFHLTRNLRNTQAIARVVQQLGDETLEPNPYGPPGEPPIVHAQESPGRMRKLLDGIITKLTKNQNLAPDQITILSPRSPANSSLADTQKLAGHPVSHKPNDRKGAVLHTTIGAFKGLESDVILLIDIDPDHERSSRNARYVAASRARHRLVVFSKGDWLA
jgi:ATP:corrinoid adenosyltransferase